MKICKLFIVLTAFLLGVMGMQPVAQAALSNGGYTTAYMDPVSLYLFDLNGDGQAMLSANTISVGPALAPTLKYSVNGSKFSDFDTSALINFNGSKVAQISLLVSPNDSMHSIASGDVTFQNYDAANGAATGHDLFHALYVQWDNSPLAVTFASTDERFSSSAPIPASVLLLFTGLVGVVGFRRRMMR